MVEISIELAVTKIVTGSHFGYNYIARIMAHAITKVFFVAPRHKSTKTQQHLINNSTVAITIVTIDKIKTMPGGLVQTVN